jgi:hypothetical protein
LLEGSLRGGERGLVIGGDQGEVPLDVLDGGDDAAEIGFCGLESP